MEPNIKFETLFDLLLRTAKWDTYSCEYAKKKLEEYIVSREFAAIEQHHSQNHRFDVN